MNNQQIYYPDTTHLGLPTADQVRGASRGVNGPDWQSQTCRVVAPMLPVASTPRFLPPKGFPFFSTSKLMTPGPALDLHNRSRAPPVFLQVFSSPPQKKRSNESFGGGYRATGQFRAARCAPKRSNNLPPSIASAAHG